MGGTRSPTVHSDSSPPKSPVISSSCSRAAWRSTRISPAMTSGAGRFSEASRLSSAASRCPGWPGPVHQFAVGEPAELLSLRPLRAVVGVVAGHEVVQVVALQGIGLQGEVLVGPQVVDPPPPGGRRLATGPALEEQHVAGYHDGRADERLLERSSLPPCRPGAPERTSPLDTSISPYKGC